MRCDRCETYKYGFSSEGCKNCDCDRIGSKDLQCDPFGQCHCVDNVEGRRCDRCKENKYDRQRGCVDCPHCYNLVQEAVHTHNEKLARLSKILDEIEKNPTVIDDETFETQLKEVQRQINGLYDFTKDITNSDDKSLIQKLEEINERRKEISRTLSEIDENIFTTGERGDLAEESVSSAGDTLKEAEDELNKALDTLLIDGKAALDKAKQTAKEFGQQSDKMTNIAQEARKIAEELDDKANNLTEVAQEAKNLSTQAYELARNTTEQQVNVTNEIRKLRYDVAHAEDRLERTKEWTEEVHNRAKDAKDNALNLLKEVNNIIVPNVDIPKLKEKADAIKQEALQLINEAEDLISKNEELLSNVTEHLIEGENLLEDGMAQQDEVNDILSDIDLAKAQATNAVELGDKTLKEAQETLKTLSGK